MLRGAAIQLAVGIVISTMLGCATKRGHYDVPSVPVPARFKQAAAVRAELEPKPPIEGEATPVQTKSEPLVGTLLAEWWRILANQELDALVDRVIANNSDLRIASLRIVQAKARADQAVSDQWPTLGAQYQAKGEGPKNGIGTVPPSGKTDTLHTYQLGLRSDWRVDLWGERSALAESSRMQLLRATYQRDDTRRQLIASAVAFYVEYLSLNDRIRVARDTEVVLRSLLDSISKRVELGDATVIDLEQQRTSVYAVQATIPALELQREAIANALAQLLGVTPSSLALSDRSLDSLTFPDILPGVPAGLVLRRPDVRVVETRLLAADADIEVARARLLPQLDLTAQLGYGSFILSQLLQPHTVFWNLISSMSASIFDHGKRSNEVVFSEALREELVETYVNVIYAAVRETEDAIATIQMNGKRLEAQKAATDAARRAWEFSMESYDAGIGGNMTLIDTERTYHRTLDEYLRIRMERMRGVASLFSALGGGIPQADSAPPSAQPTLAQDDKDGLDNESRKTLEQLPGEFAPLDADQGKDYWLVELAGLPDRHGIVHVWRDLRQRFPKLMQGRSMLQRLQGRVALDYRERASWYRLYVVRFDVAEDAHSFCGQLTKELQRCRVVSSLDQDFINVRQTAVEEIRTSAELAKEVTTPQGQGADIEGDFLPALRMSDSIGREPTGKVTGSTSDTTSE